MLHNNHCPANAPGSPASAVFSEVPARALEFISDHFIDDPTLAHQMRGSLRTWFAHNVIDWEERMGPNIERQIHHYVVLDEMLSRLSVVAFKQSAE